MVAFDGEFCFNIIDGLEQDKTVGRVAINAPPVLASEPCTPEFERGSPIIQPPLR
jgi:hypothetical protein